MVDRFELPAGTHLYAAAPSSPARRWPTVPRRDELDC